MKLHALAALLFAAVALSSARALACGTDDPADPPCVTRISRGWSFDAELHEQQTRVQVTTWQWVWDDDAGTWVQRAVVEDQTRSDRDEHQDFSEWQDSVSGAAWDWNSDG